MKGPSLGLLLMWKIPLTSISKLKVSFLFFWTTLSLHVRHQPRPDAFKSIIEYLVDKWVAAASDVKLHNLCEPRALFLTICHKSATLLNTLGIRQHTVVLIKVKRKHPLFSENWCLWRCRLGSCSKDLVLHQPLQVHWFHPGQNLITWKVSSYHFTGDITSCN